MDQVYSLALLASLTAGGLAAAACLLAARPVFFARDSRSWKTWAFRASLTAWMALVVSVSVHLAFGHRPGSPQALAPMAFLAEHRAFLVSGGLAAATLFLSRRGLRG